MIKSIEITREEWQDVFDLQIELNRLFNCIRYASFDNAREGYSKQWSETQQKMDKKTYGMAEKYNIIGLVSPDEYVVIAPHINFGHQRIYIVTKNIDDDMVYLNRMR